MTAFSRKHGRLANRPDRAQVCEVPFRPSVNPSARELAHPRGEDAVD